MPRQIHCLGVSNFSLASKQARLSFTPRNLTFTRLGPRSKSAIVTEAIIDTAVRVGGPTRRRIGGINEQHVKAAFHESRARFAQNLEDIEPESDGILSNSQHLAKKKAKATTVFKREETSSYILLFEY